MFLTVAEATHTNMLNARLVIQKQLMYLVTAKTIFFISILLSSARELTTHD